jgi:hypothetical protein
MADERVIHPNSLKNLEKGRFKPGEVSNPEGGRAVNPEMRKIRKLTTEEVVEVGSFLLSNNILALQRMTEDALANPDSEHSALKIWIARVVLTGSRKGDAYALEVVLNRLIGKVAEKMNFEGLNLPQVIVSLPSNGREIKTDESKPSESTA